VRGKTTRCAVGGGRESMVKYGKKGKKGVKKIEKKIE